MVEPLICNQGVVGSIPILSSMVDVYTILLAISALGATHIVAFYFGTLHGSKDSKEEIELLGRQVSRLIKQNQRLMDRT